MWDWFVRMWRIEWALWVCYWRALERDDHQSVRYCADHSLLVSVFWLVMILAGTTAFGIIVRVLQGCW
ncbi:MAG: hypothetical protein AAGU23_11265 [Bacillota bacterium]